MLKDYIKNSDYNLYYKYNINPYFLYIHLLLIIIQTLIIFNQKHSVNLIKPILASIYNFNDNYIHNKYVILTTIDDIKQHTSKTINNIYSYYDNSFLKFILNTNSKLKKQDIINENVVYNYNLLDYINLFSNNTALIDNISDFQTKFYNKQAKNVFKLNNNWSFNLLMYFNIKTYYNYKPFSIVIKNKNDNPFNTMSNKDIRNLLKYVNSFYINYDYDIMLNNSNICFKIKTKHMYNLEYRGEVKYYLTTSYSNCLNDNNNQSKLNNYFKLEDNYILILILVAIAIIELTISFKKILFSFKLLYQVRHNLIKNNQNYIWENMKFSHKLKFFNYWHLLFALNSVLIILSKP